MRILYNAHIFTQNPSQPAAGALVIDHGRIAALGSDDELLARFPAAEKEDLQGAYIYPGLIDAHLHMQYYSLGLQRVDCETETRQQCLRRVGERAAITPPGEWIIGHGWNQNVWADGFGSAAELDAVAPNHPVFLTSKSIHSAWANSRALQLAGVSASTPDPEGGAFQRDGKGFPTGILFEGAMEVVSRAIPEPGVAEVQAAIATAQETLWRMGLVGVHDYDRATSFAALQQLDRAGQLGLRVNKSIPMDGLPHAVALGLRSGFGSDWLRIGSVKLFADGALGPRTAAMLQPYEGESSESGLLLLDAEDVIETGRVAVDNGFSLAIHAIGDRANHEVLNGLEQLRAYEQQHGLPGFRHRIEHVQILHPMDHERLRRLGVIASMQPIHATSDMRMADRNWGARSKDAYALNTVLSSGAAYAFGSDAPVESPNPFWGLHAAVTRRRQDGSPGTDGWYPQQRIDLAQALHGFTIGAAYAAGLEDRQGWLGAGCYADLIVLERDLFALPPEDLFKVKPLATMAGGDWKWKA